jgi:hypothetical protein
MEKGRLEWSSYGTVEEAGCDGLECTDIASRGGSETFVAIKGGAGDE